MPAGKREPRERTGGAGAAMPSAQGWGPRGCGMVQTGSSLSPWLEAFAVVWDSDSRATGQDGRCAPVCGALCLCRCGFGGGWTTALPCRDPIVGACDPFAIRQ